LGLLQQGMNDFDAIEEFQVKRMLSFLLFLYMEHRFVYRYFTVLDT